MIVTGREPDLPIATPGAYVNLTNAQTITARLTDEYGCRSTITLTLYVNPLPSPTPTEELEPYVFCDDNNDGYAQFDLSTQDELILNDEPDVEITYYLTMEAAEEGDPLEQLPDLYANIAQWTQTIFVRATNRQVHNKLCPL